MLNPIKSSRSQFYTCIELRITDLSDWYQLYISCKINIKHPLLLWQKICQSSHTILVHYSVCEDSEVSRSITPIHVLNYIRLDLTHVCLLLQGAVIMHDGGF